MNKAHKLALAATLALALALTFSCSSAGTPEPPPQIEGSSSSNDGSSSLPPNLALPSSSSNAKVYTRFCVIDNSCYEVEFYDPNQNCNDYGFIPVSYCPNISISESSSSALEANGSSSSLKAGSSSSALSSSSTYLLTCMCSARTGISGVAIANPTVICNGAVVSARGWTPNINWANPSEGTYNVSAMASCGDINKTATCCTITIINASSSSKASSSSYSSSSIAVVYGTPVTYEGETYPTVVIGIQTWFAKNLNYAIDGSKCYDDEPVNCATYGRLYNWVTAMNLPSTCSSNKCSSQVLAKHKGICPSGWHIPSTDDWTELLSYVDYVYGSSGSFTNVYNYFSKTAGGYLKSTSGWNDYNGASGNGQDTYGFAALPSGYANSSNGFFGVGDKSGWWITFEGSVGNSSTAYVQYFANSGNGNTAQEQLKLDIFSVRCVKN